MSRQKRRPKRRADALKEYARRFRGIGWCIANRDSPLDGRK